MLVHQNTLKKWNGLLKLHQQKLNTLFAGEFGIIVVVLGHLVAHNVGDRLGNSACNVPLDNLLKILDEFSFVTEVAT